MFRSQIVGTSNHTTQISSCYFTPIRSGFVKSQPHRGDRRCVNEPGGSNAAVFDEVQGPPVKPQADFGDVHETWLQRSQMMSDVCCCFVGRTASSTALLRGLAWLGLSCWKEIGRGLSGGFVKRRHRCETTSNLCWHNCPFKKANLDIWIT